jgi:hypothetical protein
LCQFFFDENNENNDKMGPKSAEKTQPEDSKLKKVISKSLKILDRWNEIVLRGKIVVQEVLTVKKEKQLATSKNQDHSETLQKLCGQLKDIANEFELILEDLKVNSDKIKALHDLSNLSTSFNKSLGLDDSTNSLELGEDYQASKYMETILFKHQKQQELMISIAENLGNASNLDNAIFLASIWIMQPALDDENFIAMEYLRGL